MTWEPVAASPSGSRSARRVRGNRLSARLTHVLRQQVTWLSVIAALPVLVAAARQITVGWMPEGDDAVVATRIHDVFGGHPPLQGMRSTSGMFDAFLSSHHPGPLEFYADAPISALLGYSSAGFVLAVAVVNVACVVGAVCLAHRMRGARTAVPVVLALLLAQWLLGPDVLARPLNPCAGILPLVLTVVAAWAVLDRDRHGMWVMLLSGSFAAQTELAFFPLLVAVMGTAGVVVGWRAWARTHRWRAGPQSAPINSPRRRWIIGGLVLLAWLPSIIEVFAISPNNVEQVLGFAGSSRSGPRATGLGGAIGLMLGQLSPTGLSRFDMDSARTASGADTAVGLIVAVLLLLGAVAGRRLPRTAGSRGCWIVLVAVAAQAVALMSKPQSNSPTANLWLLSAMVLGPLAYGALAIRGVEFVRKRSATAPTRRTLRWTPASQLGALMVAAVLASAMSLAPTTEQSDRARAVSKAVLTYLHDNSRPGTPVRINGHGLTWIGLSPAVGLQLARDGRPAHCLSNWPYPEDNSSWYASTAPPNSIVVTIADKGSAATVHPGPDAEPIPLPGRAAQGISVWISIPTVDRA